MSTRASAKERVVRAKATRQPWRTTAGEWHTTRTYTIITRAAIVFFWTFCETVYNKLLTALIFVELVELYTLHGERSSAIFRHGRRSCAATCQILGKMWRSLIFVWWFHVLRLLFFNCMPAGRHSDSTPAAALRCKLGHAPLSF